MFLNAFATRQKWIYFKPTHLEGILDHDLLIGYSQQMQALEEKFMKMYLMIKAQFTTQVYYDFNSISTDEVRRSVTKKSFSAISEMVKRS